MIYNLKSWIILKIYNNNSVFEETLQCIPWNVRESLILWITMVCENLLHCLCCSAFPYWRRVVCGFLLGQFSSLIFMRFFVLKGKSLFLLYPLRFFPEMWLFSVGITVNIMLNISYIHIVDYIWDNRLKWSKLAHLFTMVWEQCRIAVTITSTKISWFPTVRGQEHTHTKESIRDTRGGLRTNHTKPVIRLLTFTLFASVGKK